MKKIMLLISLALILSSCGASKRTPNVKPQPQGQNKSAQKRIVTQEQATHHQPSSTHTKPIIQNNHHAAASKKAEKIVDYALGFIGTKYKYGGTSKRGLDCSGLIYLAFLNAGDIRLPRVSRAMAKEGVILLQSEIRMGDLLFFNTNKRRQRINHVALVVKITATEISFIHATTHGGVMISKLSQPYWGNAFIEARRVL